MSLADVFTQPLTEAEITNELKGAESELTFLWRADTIDRQAQARLCAFGFTELGTFAHTESDQASCEASWMLISASSPIRGQKRDPWCLASPLPGRPHEAQV